MPDSPTRKSGNSAGWRPCATASDASRASAFDGPVTKVSKVQGSASWATGPSGAAATGAHAGILAAAWSAGLVVQGPAQTRPCGSVRGRDLDRHRERPAADLARQAADLRGEMAADAVAVERVRCQEHEAIRLLPHAERSNPGLEADGGCFAAEPAQNAVPDLGG